MEDFELASKFEAMHLKNSIDRHFDEVEPCDGDGTCCDCGDPIPMERQQAMPGCRRCIACQTIYEMKGDL